MPDQRMVPWAVLASGVLLASRSTGSMYLRSMSTESRGTSKQNRFRAVRRFSASRW